MYLRELAFALREASESRDSRVVLLAVQLLLRAPANLWAMLQAERSPGQLPKTVVGPGDRGPVSLFGST